MRTLQLLSLFCIPLIACSQNKVGLSVKLKQDARTDITRPIFIFDIHNRGSSAIELPDPFRVSALENSVGYIYAEIVELNNADPLAQPFRGSISHRIKKKDVTIAPGQHYRLEASVFCYFFSKNASYKIRFRTDPRKIGASATTGWIYFTTYAADAL